MYRMAVGPVGYTHEHGGGIDIVGGENILLQSEKRDFTHIGLVTQLHRARTRRILVFLSKAGIPCETAHLENACEEIARSVYSESERIRTLEQGALVILRQLERRAQRLGHRVVAVAPESIVGRGVGIIGLRTAQIGRITCITAPYRHIAVGNGVTRARLEPRRRNLLAVDQQTIFVFRAREDAATRIEREKPLRVALHPCWRGDRLVDAVALVGHLGLLPLGRLGAPVFHGHLAAALILHRERRGVEPQIGIAVIRDARGRGRNVELQALGHALAVRILYGEHEIVARILLVASVQLFDQRHELRNIERLIGRTFHVAADGEPEIFQSRGHLVARGSGKLHFGGEVDLAQKLVGQKGRLDLH